MQVEEMSADLDAKSLGSSEGEGEDEGEASSEEELDHFPIKKLDDMIPMALLNETCRDPKRLMQFLETVK